VAAEPPQGPEQDHYAVLGVALTASQEEITRAYRRLARGTHPDTHPRDPGAEQRLREIVEAYRVLADVDRRAAYDRGRRGGTGRPVRVVVVDSPTGQEPSLGSRPFSPGFSAAPWERGPLWFGQVRQVRPRLPRRGRDLTTELTVSFAEAVYGTSAAITEPDPTGRPRTVVVHVPAGTVDGERLRVPGQGQPGAAGGDPGNLHVTVRVAPDPLYRRRGGDLAITVPVRFSEAVLGATIDIPGLSGQCLTVPIPPGTASCSVVRLPRRGVPDRSGAGDLLVTLTVDVPRQLSPTQRRAVADLGRELPDPRDHWGRP
jgi:molecular chaperone DnaJ